jgi:ligand-binding sensor domain-containing protein
MITTYPVVCKSLCTSCDGSVYLLSKDDKLMFLSDGAAVFDGLSAKIDGFISGKDISRLVCVGDMLFMADVDNSPYVLDLQSMEIVQLDFLSKMRDVVKHSSGELWVAARDGIHVLDTNLVRKRVFRPYHDNSFRCLAEDSDGGIWGGTLFEGLAYVCSNHLDFCHYSEEFSGGSFKARDFVEDAKGRIWVGSDTRGLLCLDPQKDCESSICKYFAGRNITGLMAEGNRLWVGTIDNELPVACLDSENGNIVYYRT